MGKMYVYEYIPVSFMQDKEQQLTNPIKRVSNVQKGL